MNDINPKSLDTSVAFISLYSAAGLGALAMATLAAIVVMCITTPRSPKEWAVGIISTVVSSIGGGAAVIQYYDLQSWVNTPFGLIAMLALVFTCGLPGWAFVRWVFNYIIRNQNSTITDVIGDIRGVRNGNQSQP